MVPATGLAAVTPWAPTAQAGDLLVNPSCDAQNTEREVNRVRAVTH